MELLLYDNLTSVEMRFAPSVGGLGWQSLIMVVTASLIILDRLQRVQSLRLFSGRLVRTLRFLQSRLSATLRQRYGSFSCPKPLKVAIKVYGSSS